MPAASHVSETPLLAYSLRHCVAIIICRLCPAFRRRDTSASASATQLAVSTALRGMDGLLVEDEVRCERCGHSIDVSLLAIALSVVGLSVALSTEVAGLTEVSLWW